MDTIVSVILIYEYRVWLHNFIYSTYSRQLELYPDMFIYKNELLKTGTIIKIHNSSLCPTNNSYVQLQQAVFSHTFYIDQELYS